MFVVCVYVCVVLLLKVMGKVLLIRGEEVWMVV